MAWTSAWLGNPKEIQSAHSYAPCVGPPLRSARTTSFKNPGLGHCHPRPHKEDQEPSTPQATGQGRWATWRPRPHPRWHVSGLRRPTERVRFDHPLASSHRDCHQDSFRPGGDLQMSVISGTSRARKRHLHAQSVIGARRRLFIAQQLRNDQSPHLVPGSQRSERWGLPPGGRTSCPASWSARRRTSLCRPIEGRGCAA